MSNWMEIKTQIRNLESFKKACMENQIRYEEFEYDGAIAKLIDTVKGGPRYRRFAQLCRKDDYYVIKGDTNIHYSSLAARLGSDYELLIQSYAKHEVLNNIALSGGFVTEETKNEDGSLVLRVSI